jgi:hypothetical protein
MERDYSGARAANDRLSLLAVGHSSSRSILRSTDAGHACGLILRTEGLAEPRPQLGSTVLVGVGRGR